MNPVMGAMPETWTAGRGCAAGSQLGDGQPPEWSHRNGRSFTEKIRPANSQTDPLLCARLFSQAFQHGMKGWGLTTGFHAVQGGRGGSECESVLYGCPIQPIKRLDRQIPGA